jgi:hypothetical protein
MIHLENQNGMGIGYSQDTFAIDLGTRAHLRHAAGLAASQKHLLSIQETFAAMGLPHDPRRAEDNAGYKITPIILDFIGAHAEPILLSNNPMKIQQLNNFGYSPKRLKILGEISSEGQSEAKQRSQLRIPVETNINSSLKANNNSGNIRTHILAYPNSNVSQMNCIIC